VTDQLESDAAQAESSGPERAEPAISTRTARARLAVLVAAPVVAILVLALGVGLGRSGAFEPPAAPLSLPAGATLEDPGHVYFADADHGIALLRHCAGAGCDAWLARTENGGASWEGDLVDGLSGPSGQPFALRVRLRVLDANRIALDSYDRDRRWFTTDAGRTWTQLSPDPKSTIDELPADGIPTLELGPLPQAIGVHVLLGDGATAQLAHVPDVRMTSANGEVLVAADGSAWIRGGDDKRSYAFVSRDRGRSWASVPLPAEAGADVFGAGLSTSDGHHIYVIDNWRFRAWRSTDDGRSWQSLQVPIAKPTEDIGLSGEPDAEGGLLIHDFLTRATYRFGPTDLTAGKIEKLPVRRGSNGWRQVQTDRASETFEHSSDGTNWVKLPFVSSGR
jgi:hypothetical protein